ncbi:hypothetical protein [Haloechinothrix aidingensis]|uniref:hypothetical protein n=1 Tax=Haloechinothrix aidingensis TaxID=2752311 RepID=UPI001C60CA18|nr:hypothetical protein [Haloechinothrix aidingensis]
MSTAQPHEPDEHVPGESAAAGRRSRFGRAGAAVRQAFAGGQRSWSTTPGRLSIIAVSLVAVILAAGVGASASVSGRAQATANLVDRQEPMAATVQEVYRALSDADATAAMAFLAAGDEPEELRVRYEDDIAVVGPSLALAGFDAVTGEEAAHQVSVVVRQVPVYSELVGTARANNRQGLPVGAAYLREASHLMRERVLPAVEELYRIQRERLVQAQSATTSVPFIAIGLLAVALVGLLRAQAHIRRLVKRRYNIGLVVATVALVVGLIWSAVALSVQGTLVTSGQRDGSGQVDVLVQTRIAALQARADELLALVARGDGEAYEDRFAELAEQIAGQDGTGGRLGELRDTASAQLSGPVEDAVASATGWLRTHETLRDLADGGDYNDAVELAVDTGSETGSGTAFARLDSSLAEAIQAGREEFVTSTVTGERALTGLVEGWLALAAVGAGGVVIGIRQRLREYR